MQNQKRMQLTGCLLFFAETSSQILIGQEAYLNSSFILQGLRSSNTGVASFCSTALSACEAFLHPRTSVNLLLPLQEKALPAEELLRSSILKEPISSFASSAKTAAAFAGELSKLRASNGVLTHGSNDKLDYVQFIYLPKQSRKTEAIL